MTAPQSQRHPGGFCRWKTILLEIVSELRPGENQTRILKQKDKKEKTNLIKPQLNEKKT